MWLWESYFSPAILKRGRDYYRQGRVSDLQRAGDVYIASVRGTKVYSVTARVQDKSYRLACSCPHAASGTKCKHMAAVMYAISAQLDGERAQEKQKLIKPFGRERRAADAGDYRYFDFARMAGGLTVTEDEFARARELVESGRYEQPVETDFGYDAYYSASGACVGSITVTFLEGDGRVPCSFRFSRDRILGGWCGCRGRNAYGLFSKDERLCRHQAAALLLLDRYIEENDPGDATDEKADRFLTAFRRRKEFARGTTEETVEHSVRLEPRLGRGGDGLHLSFRVGEGRLYVARSLDALVETALSGGTMAFGKSYELDFSRAGFDAESAPYFTLLRRYVDGERRGARGKAVSVGGEILLGGAVLDEFFELAKGSVLPFKDDLEPDSAAELLVTERDPQLSLDIRKDVTVGGVFQGVKAEGTLPRFYAGAEHRYYLDGGALCRVSEGFMRELSPLLDLGKGERVSFRVGRKRLPEFYYSVLPALRGRVTVREADAEEIQAHLPPELALVFWLDAEGGVPRCRAEAQYGEAAFSVRDWEADGFTDRNLRDELREREALETVRRYFPAESPEGDEYACEENDDAVYEALSAGVPALMALGEVRVTDRFRALRVKRKVKLAVGVSVQSDLLELDISSGDVPQEELLDLLSSYRLRRRYHRLKSGEFVELDESVAELDRMNEALRLTPKELIAGRAHIPAYRALYLDKMLEQCGSVEAVRDRRFRALAKDFRTVNDADFELPASLRGTLRSYQEYGYKWLRTVAAYGFGGILADDMGLGKTLQMISVLLAAREEGQGGTSLIVTPASLVYNWKEEFQKFAPSLSVRTVAGGQRERQEIIAGYDTSDVLITSYDLLKRDISYYEDCTFSFQVIDEAQYIKNHGTAAAKSVKLVKSRARFALTGTPIENRLSELWSIFDYLMPGFLYGYETFRKEFEVPIARKNDEDAKNRLRRMTAPFILRRLKTEVLRDLPEKLEETRYAYFETEQRRLYDAQITHMRQMLKSGGEESFTRGKIQILAELTRIRQICCDPALLYENYEGGSAKREACMELIEAAVEGEHRILLFSQFTSMLELLASDLRERGLEYYTITGSTPKTERLELVRRFNEGTVPVFLISLKAGGTGLNLTGADVVIHYDPWWNLAAQNQATDRAHRIGQEKVVTVYKLIARDSVEERIQELQAGKSELADAVLSGDAVRLADMTKEDMLALLEG